MKCVILAAGYATRLYPLTENFPKPVLEVQGFEADDVIGTLAKQSESIEGLDTYMMTPDKDYGQLVAKMRVSASKVALLAP